jgi:hypothetical protein
LLKENPCFARKNRKRSTKCSWDSWSILKLYICTAMFRH